jgi:hypothetical protein
MIFYAIYKNQQICLTIWVTLLWLGPWEDLMFWNVALRAAGRRGCRNPASSPRFLVGEGAEEGPWGLGAAAPAQQAALREGRHAGELW